MKQDIAKGMKNATFEYMKIIDFIDKFHPSGLIVSYDKILENKNVFIDKIGRASCRERV